MGSVATRPPDKKPPRKPRPRLVRPCSICNSPLIVKMIRSFAALQPDGTEYPIFRKSLAVLTCARCDHSAAKGRPRIPKRLGG